MLVNNSDKLIKSILQNIYNYLQIFNLYVDFQNNLNFQIHY